MTEIWEKIELLQVEWIEIREIRDVSEKTMDCTKKGNRFVIYILILMKNQWIDMVYF